MLSKTVLTCPVISRTAEDLGQRTSSKVSPYSRQKGKNLRHPAFAFAVAKAKRTVIVPGWGCVQCPGSGAALGAVGRLQDRDCPLLAAPLRPPERN